MHKFFTENLNVGYDKRIVLGNIEIDLVEGEILCLMGPNGSGKSTIIKTITDHIKKLGGKVFISGKNIEKMSQMDMAKEMSVVLTDRISPNLMTAEELVATGRYPHTNYLGKFTDYDLQMIEDSIKIVRGEKLKDKEFTSLSDGEKQRMMIARAICQEADLMVLDEPTSYLDIRYKIELLGILRSLARDWEKIIILSLHEIDLISKVADKVLMIVNENEYIYGTPEEVINNKSLANAFKLSVGRYNTELGSIELEKPKGKPKVFVMGNQGMGIDYYRALNKKNLSFFAGIIFENDIDFPVAYALAKDTVIAEDFQEISQENLEKAKNMIDTVDYFIDCGAKLSGINSKNFELLKYAKEKSKTVIRYGKNKEFSDYNFNSFSEFLQLIEETLNI
ncbi:MAG: ABC transporter ATP-binding protein [Tissierellia bacterium]|nr:ABC transporter ATP-binding protein [Tissierellia bacterium]